MLLQLIAFSPIVFLIVALGILKKPAHFAAPLGLLLAALLAVSGWHMEWPRALGAIFEGAAFALWPIMIIVLAAMFTHRLAEATGTIKRIQSNLSSVTTDKRLQVLILAWGFGGFLEAVAGYGTAVAIPAAILIAVGFRPIFAAIVCLIANTVPTAFGAVGVPVSTLAALTQLDPSKLSFVIGLQLLPFILLLPFVLVAITGGSIKAIKGVAGVCLVSGVSFAIPQLLAAYYLGPELPALLGSICSLMATVVYAAVRKEPERDAVVHQSPSVSLWENIQAWLPYTFILILIIGSSKLFPAINHPLSSVKTAMTFLEGGNTIEFKWISSPGVLIILAGTLAALIQGERPLSIGRIFIGTVIKLKKSAIVVICILATARVMDYSGMIGSISTTFVAIAGNAFPLFSPLIGALGTFVTGSDTSSNVLFGNLQVEIAHRIGIDEYWLAAANTAGATAGKMISPQSIAIATSATGLIGQEGKILQSTLPYCLGYVVLLGLMVYGYTFF